MTARDGGPAPVEETVVFEATDPKVVARVQALPPEDSVRVVFRWSAPPREVRRVSPPRLLVRGQQVVWDELPIRDAPAAGTPGLWTVEVFADERLSAVTQLRILPHPMQTVWRAGGDATGSAAISANRRAGTTSLVASFDYTRGNLSLSGTYTLEEVRENGSSPLSPGTGPQSQTTRPPIRSVRTGSTCRCGEA